MTVQPMIVTIKGIFKAEMSQEEDEEFGGEINRHPCRKDFFLQIRL